jgi:hypothetical protein
VVTGLPEATLIDLRARVVGLLESPNAAPPGIGVPIGAVIATLASPRTAYASPAWASWCSCSSP